MKIPTYMLTQKHVILTSSWDELVLPEGMFLKPIEEKWLPKHIFDTFYFRHFNRKTETACYCHFGIIPIPNNLIREVA